MRYNVFDGGNLLQHPWDVATSGRLGNYRVNYAEHHKRRTLEIEKRIDTQSRVWMGQYDGLNAESDKPIVLEDGDELATHIFGTGSLIDYVVFHIKRPGAGTIKPYIEQDDGTHINLIGPDGSELSIDLRFTGHYVGMVPGLSASPATAAAGSPTVAAAAPGTVTVNVIIPATTVNNVTLPVTGGGGGSATGSVVVPAQTVQVSIPIGAAAEGAGQAKPVPFMTTDNGVVGFTFTKAEGEDGKPMPFDTCIGIYMAVKDFWNEYDCECAPVPCDTEYPDPLCTVNPRAPAPLQP